MSIWGWIVPLSIAGFGLVTILVTQFRTRNEPTFIGRYPLVFPNFVGTGRYLVGTVLIFIGIALFVGQFL